MKTVYLVGPMPGNNFQAFHDAKQARPLDDWHEDIGAVLWWRFPVEEAPWCGTPNCDDWPGYHTHWTPLMVPHAPAASPDEPEVISERPDPETDAGGVPPGPALYEVTYTHRHRTLRSGDLVRMAETPDYNLLLLRADWTLHSLRDELDQYVHLRRVPLGNAAAEGSKAAEWFALLLCAAAALEDAANCLRDRAARRAALGAAEHYRAAAHAAFCWPHAPAAATPAAPAN